MRFSSLFFVTAGLLLTAPFAVAQATKTLTGTVSDAMCGKKHMMARVRAQPIAHGSASRRDPTTLSWLGTRSTRSRVTRLRLTSSRAQTSL